MENKHQKFLNRIFSRKSLFSAYLTLAVMTLCTCENYLTLLDKEVLELGRWDFSDPEITITEQPEEYTAVTEGNIGSIYLTVNATTTKGSLSYQWFRNSEWGYITPIDGANERFFKIPTTLTANNSPYYYFCKVMVKEVEQDWVQAEKDSEVAKVEVFPAAGGSE